MKSEILAVVLVVLVLGSLGAGYLSGVGNRQTITIVSTPTTTVPTTLVTTTTNSQSVLAETGCTTPVSQPPAGSNLTNVYVLSVPSEAAICVVYTYQGSGNQSYRAYFDSLPYGCDISPSPCTGLNGSASPSFISYNGTTNVTVTYGISTSVGLAQGTYWLIVGYYEFESLVVGQPPTNISAIPAFSSTAAPYSPSPQILVVGVTNITVEQVPCYAYYPGPLQLGCGGVGRVSD